MATFDIICYNVCMANREAKAMNVSLTPRLEELIKRKVEGGLYGNASEVVREALRLLEERDRYKTLQDEVAAGFEQIERRQTVPLDMNTLKQEAVTAAQAGHVVNPSVMP
jgi:antitoxin ParD1/3/4